MASGIPVDEMTIRQIRGFLKLGVPMREIGRRLGVAESTVRNYKNYDPRDPKFYRFTPRQLEIARAAVEKLARK